MKMKIRGIAKNLNDLKSFIFFYEQHYYNYNEVSCSRILFKYMQDITLFIWMLQPANMLSETLFGMTNSI